MEEIKTFSNKPIPDDIMKTAEKVLDGEKILFAVVGDLNLDGKYVSSAFIVTKNQAVARASLGLFGIF